MLDEVAMHSLQLCSTLGSVALPSATVFACTDDQAHSTGKAPALRCAACARAYAPWCMPHVGSQYCQYPHIMYRPDCRKERLLSFCVTRANGVSKFLFAVQRLSLFRDMILACISRLQGLNYQAETGLRQTVSADVTLSIVISYNATFAHSSPHLLQVALH